MSAAFADRIPARPRRSERRIEEVGFVLMIGFDGRMAPENSITVSIAVGERQHKARVAGGGIQKDF